MKNDFRVSKSIVFAQQRRSYKAISDKTLSSSRNHNYALENLEFIRELNALLFLDRIKKEKREKERGKKKEDNVDSAKARRAEALNSRNPSGGHETGRTLIPIAQARRTTSTRYALRDDTTCTRVHVSSSRTYAREKRTFAIREFYERCERTPCERHCPAAEITCARLSRFDSDSGEHGRRYRGYR